jgi:hypothetical protein
LQSVDEIQQPFFQVFHCDAGTIFDSIFINIIAVNEPNVIDLSSGAFANLHSANIISIVMIIHATNDLS